MASIEFIGIPLYDSATFFSKQDQDQLYSTQYPDVSQFVKNLALQSTTVESDFRYTKEFLTSYVRRSVDTYEKFRTDAERLLLWSWLICDKSIVNLRRRDFENYIDFVMNPPKEWVAETTQRRFIAKDGLRLSNPKWRPFRLTGDNSTRLNNKSLQGLYSNLSVFYNYLMAEDYAVGNPVAIVKKNCKYLVNQTGLKPVRRLSSLQWIYLLQVTAEMADSDSVHERTLFVVAALKSLKLRISELADRPRWSPTMAHFHRDHEENWWYRAFGKGGKERDVSVSDEFLQYLRRYRLSRGLVAMPSPDSKEPLIQALTKPGGIGVRQIRSLVEKAVINTQFTLQKDGFETEANELKSVTTHWLRHTGASMEVASGRPLAHVQGDLGHDSISTTDGLYVDSDSLERSLSGKNQEV